MKVIHEYDQFLQEIPAINFPLTHSVDPLYGDRWDGQVDIGAVPPPGPTSAWGSPGRYLYRLTVTATGDRPRTVDWVTDPYAREFGIGRQSAVTVGGQPYVWSASEDHWRVPAIEDLVMYELMLAEFAGNVDGAITKKSGSRLASHPLGTPMMRATPSTTLWSKLNVRAPAMTMVLVQSRSVPTARPCGGPADGKLVILCRLPAAWDQPRGGLPAEWDRLSASDGTTTGLLALPPLTLRSPRPVSGSGGPAVALVVHTLESVEEVGRAHTPLVR